MHKAWAYCVNTWHRRIVAYLPHQRAENKSQRPKPGLVYATKSNVESILATLWEQYSSEHCSFTNAPHYPMNIHEEYVLLQRCISMQSSCLSVPITYQKSIPSQQLQLLAIAAANNKETFACPVKQNYNDLPSNALSLWNPFLELLATMLSSARHHLGTNTCILLAQCHSFRGSREHNTSLCCKRDRHCNVLRFTPSVALCINPLNILDRKTFIK